MKTLGFMLVSAFFCLIHHLATRIDAWVNKAPALLAKIELEKTLNSGGYQKYQKTEQLLLGGDLQAFLTLQTLITALKDSIAR